MSQEKAITSSDDAGNEETMKSGENTMIDNTAPHEPDEVDQKDLTSVVQGTAETLLSKLEETVAATTISNRGMPFGKQMTSKKKGIVFEIVCHCFNYTIKYLKNGVILF